MYALTVRGAVDIQSDVKEQLIKEAKVTILQDYEKICGCCCENPRRSSLRRTHGPGLSISAISTISYMH